MRGRIIRVDDDRLTNPIHREVIPARLLGDDAEEVQCIGMFRLHNKDLAAKRLGIRQPARLVALDREFKSLLKRHRWRARFQLSIWENSRSTTFALSR